MLGPLLLLVRLRLVDDLRCLLNLKHPLLPLLLAPSRTVEDAILHHVLDREGPRAGAVFVHSHLAVLQVHQALRRLVALKRSLARVVLQLLPLEHKVPVLPRHVVPPSLLEDALVEGAAEGEVHEARRLLCFLRHSHCASSLDEADHSRIVLPCAQAHEVALVQEVSAGDEGAGAEDAEDGDSEVLPVVLIRDAVAEAVEMHRRVAVVLDDPLNCSLLDVVDVLIAKRLLGQVLSLAQRYGDGELVVSEHELERLDLRLDQTVVRCPVEEKVSHLWLQMNFHVECLVSQLIGAVLVQHVDIALAEDDDVAAFIERGVEH
mmetsp:Transcript_34699/g.78342  ORF Transcript_34699/g.78342 Transcript_34699/m.78342 type:complete len:319 (+) Transcript_34699:1182-2138(+)